MRFITLTVLVTILSATILFLRPLLMTVAVVSFHHLASVATWTIVKGGFTATET